MSIAASCSATEPAFERKVRLACSFLALTSAALVFAAAIVTSFFASFTMREGGHVTGNAALFALVLIAGVLLALCIALVRRQQSAARSLWVVPLVLACLAVLACTPFARDSSTLGVNRSAADLVFTLAGALFATLLLTQVAGRLARRNACSCS